MSGRQIRLARSWLPAGVLASMLLLVGCSTQAPRPCDPACAAQQRRDHYVAVNPQLSDRLKAAIRSGRVVVGMSKEDVLAAIGSPDNAVDIHSAWIEREQWVYGEKHAAAGLYFFRFGRLHGWTAAAN